MVIHSIFTDKMFAELQAEMQNQDISGLAELEQFWIDDYRQRMAIRGFLKDKTIGMKRLSSMPDRITNTINLHDGGRYTRPTAINSYNRGSLDSVDAWWALWKEFMFHTSVEVCAGGRKAKGPELVCRLISSIPRSKYPAITEEEQAISVPLQILCLAILDAIFVHMLNVVQPRWEDVRRELCDALIANKAPRVCAIIARSYADMDVVFLQEAAAVFATHALATPALLAKYALLSPHDLDGKRDQNSLILADRRRFRAATAVPLTREVQAAVRGAALAPGDLVAVSVEDAAGRRWLLASFHGDSGGLATRPALRALDAVARGLAPPHALLVGIDANTLSSAGPGDGPQSVPGLCRFLDGAGMVSAWGAAPPPGLRTTCTART